MGTAVERGFSHVYLNKTKKRSPVPLINGKVIYVTQEKIKKDVV